MGTEYKWDGLDEMEKALAKLISTDYPRDFKKMVLKLAYELQGEVKESTPIGETGNLADGWQVGKIKRIGDGYVIEVYTNVEYAEHVEYGHRTRGGKGDDPDATRSYVPGEYMMTMSLERVRAALPGYLRDWLSDFISTHDL